MTFGLVMVQTVVILRGNKLPTLIYLQVMQLFLEIMFMKTGMVMVQLTIWIDILSLQLLILLLLIFRIRKIIR